MSALLPENEVSPFDGVLTVAGSELTPRKVDWLFEHWLARGKFHILAGEPGVGKTTLAISLAATLSKGGNWPDGQPCQQGNVLIWSDEDDAEDTLLPRFLAMEGYANNVHFVTGVKRHGVKDFFDPARDMAKLQAACKLIDDVSLIIIDPCSTTVLGDSHKNADVRKGLQPLVDLADSIQCAVLGITHFAKSGGNPLTRVIGSVGFCAVPRIVLVAGKSKDSNGNGGHVLCKAKSNIGPDDGGFYYDLAQVPLPKFSEIKGSTIVWCDAAEGTAEQLLGEAHSNVASTALGRAKTFLLALLQNGSVPSPRIFSEAIVQGISKNTLERAKQKLGIQVQKQGMEGGWVWQLPSNK